MLFSTSLNASIPHISFLCCPQAVEKLVQGAESGCPTEREKQVVLNSTRILSRILPYIFEDQDWRGFFWSTVPGAGRAGVSGNRNQSVRNALFIPGGDNQNTSFNYTALTLKCCYK